MACQVLEFTSNDAGYTQYVFSESSTPLDECGKSNPSERVIFDVFEYQELAVKAGQVATIDQAAAAIDPVEVSAVYGAAFAMVIFLSAIAYKIKVGKRLIKLV